MSQLSPVLRSIQDSGLAFKCPGCNEMHVIHYGTGTGPRWTWNGDVNRPTFTPSVLVRSGHYAPHYNKEKTGCWCDYNERYPGEEPVGFKCSVCHSFVKDGMIQFLGDCTHELANQTVPLGVCTDETSY